MVILTHIRDNFANAFFPRWSEWWAANLLMVLGFVLTSNPDLMASSKSNAYQLMLMIFTQETWSAVMKVFAFCRLLVLLINGAWRRSPHLRATGAFLSCFFWVQITLSVAHRRLSVYIRGRRCRPRLRKLHPRPERRADRRLYPCHCEED
ncbi:hypothetical protein E2F50_01045 [Rhizobium deserti]|uniref:Uncharacterized protein n=1 Tax=Rhizobium deserti TaxID=2547961 RepID=A0A4V3APQ7_9HYPH|nr:hypothetical protein [Rhizobium deserti]TDK38770.1 hypothetical protein E2F50_01045 [Rhizobium deserti]